MSLTIDAALDPNTGLQIPQNDPRFSALSVYYRLKAQFDKEVADTTKQYYDRTWHDWVVNYLLQGGHSTNPVPQPPLIHVVRLNPNYTIQIAQTPVGGTPEIPDPTKFTVQGPDSNNEYHIVPITAPNTGGVIVGTNLDSLISTLKALSSDDRIGVISAVLS